MNFRNKFMLSKLILFLLTFLFSLFLLSACAASPEPTSPEIEDIGTDMVGNHSVGRVSEIYAGERAEMFYEELRVCDDRVWNGVAWVEPTDPDVTQRQSVEPNISCDVQWESGVSGDDGILEAIRNYFSLLLTLQCAPDAAVEATCCTESLREEATFRAYMYSAVLYHRIEEKVLLGQPHYSAPDTAEVSVTTDGTQYTSQITECSATNQENYCGVMHLTLKKTGERWMVTENGTGSDNYFWNGVAAPVQPEKEIRQAVESYFRMRADEMAGQLGDTGYTTSALLAEATDFAAALNIFRIYETQTMACKYGSPQYSNWGVRVPVTEVMRVSHLYYYQQKPVVGTRFITVDHVLTLQSFDERYLVVGDLYRYGDHVCSIVDYLN